MTRERSTQRRADVILTNKVDYELKAAVAKVYTLIEQEPLSEEDLMEAIIDANEWISFTAGNQNGLYDFYRFRLYRCEDKIFVAQGTEYDTGAKGR